MEPTNDPIKQIQDAVANGRVRNPHHFSLATTIAWPESGLTDQEARIIETFFYAAHTNQDLGYGLNLSIKPNCSPEKCLQFEEYADIKGRPNSIVVRCFCMHGFTPRGDTMVYAPKFTLKAIDKLPRNFFVNESSGRMRNRSIEEWQLDDAADRFLNFGSLYLKLVQTTVMTETVADILSSDRVDDKAD